MARRSRGADELRRIDTVANAFRYFASVVVVLVAGMLMLNELGISIAPILASHLVPATCEPQSTPA